jgi:hypothetical protein
VSNIYKAVESETFKVEKYHLMSNLYVSAGQNNTAFLEPSDTQASFFGSFKREQNYLGL